MTSQRRIPDVLPPPVTQPLADDDADLRALGKCRSALLWRIAEGETVLAVMRTGSAVDTGSWFGKRRVCLAFTPTSLLVFASGPQPLCRRVLLTDLRQTQYNTVTGELILAPADVPVRAVALTPLKAARALAQIGRG